MNKTWMKPIAFLLVALLVSAIILPFTSERVKAATGFQDVPSSHWGAAHIQWAVDNGVAKGDGNGMFRPNDAVTEPEFLAMLTQTYPKQITVPASAGGSKWYAAYYQKAESLGWPLTYETAGKGYNRGDVARLIAYTAGSNAKTTDEAIRYLLAEGLAKGKTGSTVAGYKAADSLTRAEAVSFLHNLKDLRPSLSDRSEAASDGLLTLFGIALGDTEASVKERMGEPARKDPSGYPFTWHIYNQDLEKYAQIGIQDGKVVALYSNAAGAWQNKNGGKAIGATKAEIAAAIGRTTSGSGGGDSLRDNDPLVETVYYFDKHADNRVEGVFHARKAAVSSNLYQRTAAAERAMERQVLELTNVFRLKFNVAALAWDDPAAAVARAHSTDMKERDYFDHTNPDGLSPFDRMKAKGLTYSTAGENIAFGYQDAPSVHNGWINSMGHRENMLEAGYKRLGVGIAGVYYTQNFYTPRR